MQAASFPIPPHQRPRKRFYTKRGRYLLVPNRPVRKFIAPTRLVPRQTPSDTSHDLCPARHTDISSAKIRCGANRSAASKNATSGRQMIASNTKVPARHEANNTKAVVKCCRDPAKRCNRMVRITDRRVYEHRTSCHAPGDSARWDHRSWSPDRVPAATTVLPTTTRYRTPRRGRAARSRERPAR